MRFRPEQHLRRQSDFRAVREQGRRINCGAFTFACLLRVPLASEASEAVGSKNAAADKSRAGTVDANVTRVALVASTSAVGHAVLRNRAKRRLREVFRRHQQSVPPGCDLILTARTATTLWPMAELEQKFLGACGQVSPRKDD